MTSEALRQQLARERCLAAPDASFGAVETMGGEDGLIWGRRPPDKEYFGFRGAREPPSSQEASDSATPSTCAPVGTALALRARSEARRLAGDRRRADGRTASSVCRSYSIEQNV